MLKVAVAGGTGGIGCHVIEGILSMKKYTVVVLSRSSSNPTLEALSAQIIAVDYNDNGPLISALQGVHTVISTLFFRSSVKELLASQLALLQVMVKASVKQFGPSEFAVHGLPGNVMLLYWLKLHVVDAITQSGLEWMIFKNG